MSFSDAVVNIMENWIDRIGRVSVLSPSFGGSATIAYSGGKDSALCLLFAEYLNEKYALNYPAIFHLDHMIRDNAEQESEIASFLRAKYPQVILKKKIFPVWRVDFASVLRKQEGFSVITA
jgi:tRNA(Ile)-lysidine synthase TilS/MesJ